jgi:Protein of unknown function (DUF3592)
MKSLWTLTAGLAFAMGVALCAGAFANWRAYQDFAAQALHMDGTVSELQPRRSASGETTTPIIQFKTQDGSIIHISGPAGSSGKTYAPGDHVPVLYDPLRPGQTRIDDFDQTWGRTLWFGVFGIPLLLSGGALLANQWRQRRRKLKSGI